MARRTPRFEGSRLGEVVAVLALLVTVGIWWTTQSERAGATQKQLDSNLQLLTRRDRENDALEKRIAALEHDCRDSRPTR